jgi:hypothetical protein
MASVRVLLLVENKKIFGYTVITLLFISLFYIVLDESVNSKLLIEYRKFIGRTRKNKN